MANTKAKKTETRSKKFEMPTAITVLLIVVCFAVFLTWVVPASFEATTDITSGDSEFLKAGTIAYGVFDTFMAVGVGFGEQAPLIFFLFMFGAFLQIIISSGAMEAGVGGLVKKMNGKEIFMIPILMMLFSLGGTVYGMGEETPPFYVILVPVLILAGFDAMTGTLTVLMGAAVGVMGSTINPFMIGAAVSASDMTDVTMGDGMGFRFLSWIILSITAISFVTWYAWRVKHNPEKSIFSEEERSEHNKWATDTYHLEDLPSLTNKRKVLLGLLGLSMVLIIVMMLPWGDLLGIEPKAAPGSEWASRLMSPLGLMYFGELGFLFLFMAIVAGIIAGYNEKKIVSEAMIGAKDMMSVALVIAVAKGVGVILGGGEETAKVMNIEVLSLDDYFTKTGDKFNSIAVGNSLFIIDSSISDWSTSLIDNSGLQYDLVPIYEENIDDTKVNTMDAVIFSGSEGTDYITKLANAYGLDNVNISIDLEGSTWLDLSSNASISNTLLDGMSTGLDNIDPVGVGPIVMLIQIPMSFLIPSTSGLAGVSMPIFAPLADTLGNGNMANVAQVITGTSYASGLVNMVTPSSGILMVGLALGRVGYDKYIKLIWPLLGVLLILGLLLATIPAGF